MKSATAMTTYTVDFGRPRIAKPVAVPVGRVPRVARVLALAHRIDAMIRAGELKDLAEAARVVGVTRARMTQIMNLMLLAPKIQEEILELPPVAQGRDPISERQPRAIVGEPVWERQMARWASIRAEAEP